MGPWELAPNNPLWRNGVDDEVQNTGHLDLVEDVDGNWWAVLLAVRPMRKGDQWEESVFGGFVDILILGRCTNCCFREREFPCPCGVGK